MADISLVRTADKSVIEKIYLHPSISRISNDTYSAKPIYHPLANYAAAYINGNFVGAFLLIRATNIELDLHALLWSSASKYFRELGKKCIELAFSDPLIQRVTAYVSAYLASVRNYCLKLGFVREGARRDACVKNGASYDVEIFGLTRKEWGEKWAS